MNPRRKIRLGVTLAVLGGIGLTLALVVYALRTNIDLFYTPEEVLYGKHESGAKPQKGERLRVGGYVLPGSVQRDNATLNVTFTLYDKRASINVTYSGVLPDLFREDQAVVVQGVLTNAAEIRASEVLAKHDENYTPPELSQSGKPRPTADVLQGVKNHAT